MSTRGRGSCKFGRADEEEEGSGLRAWGEDPDEERDRHKSRGERSKLDQPLEPEDKKSAGGGRRRSPSRSGGGGPHKSNDERENSHRKRDGERLTNGHRERRGRELDKPLEPENGQRRRRSREPANNRRPEPANDRRHNDSSRKRGRSKEKASTPWIRLDNIPSVAESKHLTHLFTTETSKVLSCVVKASSAYVHFEKAASAVEAVKLFDGGELNGRLLAVKLEFSPPERSPDRWGGTDEPEQEQPTDACESEKKHKKDKRARH